MPEKKLRATLTELQSQLDNAEGLTEEDTVLLNELHDRIDRLLEQTQETRREHAPVVHAEVGGIVERFERDHPDLTRVLGAIAQVLSNVGI